MNILEHIIGAIAIVVVVVFVVAPVFVGVAFNHTEPTYTKQILAGLKFITVVVSVLIVIYVISIATTYTLCLFDSGRSCESYQSLLLKQY